jgi:hypothetical protein
MNATDGNIVTRYRKIAENVEDIHLAALIAVVQQFDFRGAMQCIVGTVQKQQKIQNKDWAMLTLQKQHATSLSIYTFDTKKPKKGTATTVIVPEASDVPKDILTRSLALKTLYKL